MNTDQDKTPSLEEGDYMRLLLRHENALRALARSLPPSWDAVDDVVQAAGHV